MGLFGMEITNENKNRTVMKRLSNLLTLALCLSLWTLTARAEEKYNRDASHYGVRLEGTNKLRFTIPTYEKRNYDCWDTEVYIYITPTGGAKETVLYLKSEEEMRSLFPYVPEAIDRTREIAERCNVEIEFGVQKLPRYDVPDGFSAALC